MNDNVQFIPMVCPNCNGKLMISEKLKEAVCNYCGNKFMLFNNTNITNESCEKFLKLAKSEEDLEQYVEALKYYNKALEIDPENYLAWFGKAFTIGKTSTIDTPLLSEAKKYFIKAIDKAPQAEKHDLEQKAAIDIAGISANLAFDLWSDADSLFNFNCLAYSQNSSRDKKIRNLFLQYQSFMFSIIGYFDQAVNIIEIKQELYNPIAIILIPIKYMSKNILLNYLLGGFMGEKKIPNEILKLDDKELEQVNSFLNKYVDIFQL